MFIALTIILLIFGSFTLGSVAVGGVCGYLDKNGGNGLFFIILFFLWAFGGVFFWSALFGYLSVVENWAIPKSQYLVDLGFFVQ